MQPDLVFTDIVMPQMGGLQLIKEALEEFPDIRFVVLSCHNDYEFVREALTLGARDYILKLLHASKGFAGTFAKTVPGNLCSEDCTAAAKYYLRGDYECAEGRALRAGQRAGVLH